jgi:nicotinamide mononucleotide transporter
MLSGKGSNSCPFLFMCTQITFYFCPRMTDSINTMLEWSVLGLNLVFIILLIRENIWCWLFGIIASIISVYLFLDAKLYSETLLYSVYIILGIYAWIHWQANSVKATMPIQYKKGDYHLVVIAIGVAVWFGLGYFFKTQTDSKLPWADAFSTSFAFVATYLEAKKILHHWLYWIVINIFSIWLYRARELNIMALMMLGFAVFSIVGFIIWTKKHRTEKLSV